MRSKIQQNIRHKLWVGILLIGYIAVIFSHLILLPGQNGGNDVLNAKMVSIFNAPSAHHSNNGCIQNKNAQSLHLRIYKHYDTEKSVFIVPKFTVLLHFTVKLPKPLYYYHNHFVSTFLYFGAGRAPPVIA